jgi:hypothetical protein
LTTARVAAWKKAFLARAEGNPVSQRGARISVNFFLRSVRSLFSEKIRRDLNIALPEPLPFAGVQLEQRPNSNTSRALILVS